MGVLPEPTSNQGCCRAAGRTGPVTAEVVADHAAARGFRCVGLTGMRVLVESEVYPDKLAARGLEYARPDEEEREEINRIIVDELVYGVFKPEAVAYHQRVITRMKDRGCDAVVLGCTEIPLIMNDSNSPLPTLDSTRLLARAALRRSVCNSTVTTRDEQATTPDSVDRGTVL